MESQPFSYTGLSPFAPFRPEGPLPPGLKVESISSVYKSHGLRPKTVLRTMGIRISTEPPRRTLRLALDDPEARRGNPKRPPFHQALYTYLISQAKYADVFSRLIEPCLDTRNDALFLDADKFKATMFREEHDPANEYPEIAAGSLQEALALFVLAFGLLEPDQANEIAEPLLKSGLCFRRFFGVDSEGAVRSEKQLDTLPHPPKASADVSSTSDNSAISIPAHRTHGPLHSEFMALRKGLEVVRAKRIHFGQMDLFEQSGFDEAYRAEQDSIVALKEFGHRIEHDLSETIHKLESRVSDHLTNLTVRWPTQDPLEQADWLDTYRKRISAAMLLLDQMDDHNAARVALQSVQDDFSGPALDIENVLELIKHVADCIELSRHTAEEFDAQLGLLRSRLADCDSVRQAQSLKDLSASEACLLINWALSDEDAEPLLPLFFRLTAECTRSGLTPEDSSKLLLTALNRYAEAGEDDSYQELLSFVPTETLQELLLTGSDYLVRHIILITLRESLSRSVPHFLTEIWPYFARWTDSERCVGQQVQRLVIILEAVYQTSESMHSVSRVLANCLASNSSNLRFDDISFTKQSTQDLANSLESPGNVDGIYRRLRNEVCTRYLKPIATNVRARRLIEVRRGLTSLRRELLDDHVSDKVIARLDDRRGLHAGHERSLKRYLQSKLTAIERWITEQEKLEKRDDSPDADDNLRRFTKELAPLAHKLHSEENEAAVVGSQIWLEYKVRQVIEELASGHRPEPSFAFFGQLPPHDCLFQHDNPKTFATWFDQTPQSKHSWVAFVKGHLNWADILQDAIAHVLLKCDDSPVHTIEALIDAGEFEAALRTSRFSTFKQDRVESLLAKARSSLDQRTQLLDKIYAADQRASQLLNTQSPSMSDELGAIQATLYEALKQAEENDLSQGQRLVDETSSRLGQIEAEHHRTREAHRLELKDLRNWLERAGEKIPPDPNLDMMRNMKKAQSEAAGNRRRHIRQLIRLDSTGVPEQLRASVRRCIAVEDQPDKWPSDTLSADAEFYIELLCDISDDWWALVRNLDRNDVTRQRIDEIAGALAAYLPDEVRALVSGDSEHAPLLRLLASDSTDNPSQYHSVLLRNGFLKAAAPQSAPPPTLNTASQLAQNRLDRAITQAAVNRGSLGETSAVFSAFGSADYATVVASAPAVWGALREGSRTTDADLVAGMYAWSAYQAGTPLYKHSEIDALGALIRYKRRLRERSTQLSVDRFLLWWVGLVRLGESVAEDISTKARVSSTLMQLRQHSSDSRDMAQFAALIEIAGEELTELLWEETAGQNLNTLRARSALLIFLYDLNEFGLLDSLFLKAGVFSRYLSAFRGLAVRARSNPTSKIYSALQQSFLKLQSMKERPFKEFADHVFKTLEHTSTGIDLALTSDSLERDPSSKDGYVLTVEVIPDQTDPPFSMVMELLGNSDFECRDKKDMTQTILDHELLFDTREIDFVVKPKQRHATTVSVRVTGDTSIGRSIDKTQSFSVKVNPTVEYVSIPLETLLDAYAGWDARPVKNSAFVGRDDELEVLRLNLLRERPGAVVLYGSRRLGKTSLLDEYRRRHCITNSPNSKSLCIVVPVDEFSFSTRGSTFLDKFFKHIWHSILFDPKNMKLRTYFEDFGVTRKDFELIGKLDGLDDASFLRKLSALCDRLIARTDSRVNHVVLLFDEFDKLLEIYRGEHRAEVEELINQLRRAATEEDRIGLALAGSDLMKEVIGLYRSALYGSAVDVKLGYFSSDKDKKFAKQIIAPQALGSARSFGEDAVTEIIDIAGGHPLYMRLLSCAAAYSSRRNRVSRSVVLQATRDLLSGGLLGSYLPEPTNLVKQPLQALLILKPEDRVLSELLLLQIARRTTLEQRWVSWGNVVEDDQLLRLKPKITWGRLRQLLLEAHLICSNPSMTWGFALPILAEAMRTDPDMEHERLLLEFQSIHSSVT